MLYKSKSILSGALLACVGTVAIADTVNVYSYRQGFLTKPLFDAFTKKTGYKVRVVYAKSGLIERIKTEGRNTRADVIMTVDITNLAKVKKHNISQSVSSAVLSKNIPESMQDAQGRWYGLSQRSRVLYVSKKRVKNGAIQSYKDLADPKWKGQICMRSATHKYNIGLTAFMVTKYGETYTQKWLKGLKDNLARRPQGNDRAQIKAVYEGVCNIAIANDYYYGKMLADKTQRKWANSVNIVWPNQSEQGVHVNLAGIALVKHSNNKKVAIALIEFLSSPEAQKIYAEVNNERPVNPKVAVSKKVKSWYKGKNNMLKIDYSVHLSDVAKNARKAVMLINKSGLNQ